MATISNVVAAAFTPGFISSFSCPPGTSGTALLGAVGAGGTVCYPKCARGYEPDLTGFACASVCNQKAISEDPLILENTGSRWADMLYLCGKDINFRGIGIFRDACSDANREIFVGLCYTKCDGGKVATTWSPMTCSQSCPPNTKEGGFANCTKVNEYGRGLGNQGNGCPGGFSNMGLYCYRWWEPAGSGFNCPGNCRVIPANGGVLNGAFGLNPDCQSITFTSVAVATATDKNFAYKGGGQTNAVFNIYGCYKDPNNPNSFAEQRENETTEPMYFQLSKYPKWHSSSGCERNEYWPNENPNWASDKNLLYGGPNCTTNPDDDSRPSQISNPTLAANISAAYGAGGVFSSVSIPVPTGKGAQENTVRVNKNDNDCSENWGSLCYPKCDYGFVNAACCICSPSCGDLRDDGATCHRSWNDRGIGHIPDACRDLDRSVENLLCYKTCRNGYKSDGAMFCYASGCPYKGSNETLFLCTKNLTGRGAAQFGAPPLAGKFNSKINVGPLAASARSTAINAAITLLILFFCIFLLISNAFLRTKAVKAGSIKL